MPETGFSEWLDGLAPEDQAKAQQLANRFRGLGATEYDTASLTQSDLTSDGPAYATFALMHAVWQRIDGWRDRKGLERTVRIGHHDRNESFSDADRAVVRMVEAGASIDDLCSFARMVAYAASFDVLHIIDEASHPDRHDPVGWALMEINDRGLTGRQLQGLHEWVLGSDPTGREGRPA